MQQKKLKYSAYLGQFSNCPPVDFQEKEMMAYRWVHSSSHPNDFLPKNLITDPPVRMLDISDKMCMGYGLSMFDSQKGACEKYLQLWNGKRAHQRVQMGADLGKSVAQLDLQCSDGVSGSAEKYGHFTFHEYQGVELSTRITGLMDIFDMDGNA